MKKGIYFLLISFLAILIFTGCSSSKNNKASPTPTAAVEELSEPEPGLTEGIDRMMMTDPALYGYLNIQSQSTEIINTNQSGLSTEEQKKIGVVSKIKSVSKYGLGGTAEILSGNQIRLKSFSYNGACGTLEAALTRSDIPTQKIVVLKTYPTAVSANQEDLTIPQKGDSRVRLTEFDTIGFYCPDKKEPVSTASF